MNLMRRFLAIPALFLLAAAAMADGWLIKAPYDAKAKLTWKVTITANVAGGEHEASMNQILTVNSKSDKEIKAKGKWSDLTVDGAAQDSADEWDVILGLDGAVLSAGDNADYVRMLTPLVFVYPDKEIKVGDKWTRKAKPAKDGKDLTMDYEVAETTKVGEVEVMRIKAKLTEDGPMKGDITYWVAKDGRVMKFEFDLKNWVVPIAAGIPDFDAKGKGELVKNG